MATPPADEATALFKKGIAAHDAGKLADAEELFTKAWALKKTWDIAANLGLVESRLGKHAAAATHLAYAARMVPPTEPAASTAELTKLLEAERSQVGMVKVHANVDGAEVRVGGELKGTTPIDGEIFVTPGTVAVDVVADGYEPVRKTVDVVKGGSAEATLTLVPKALPERSKVPAYVIGGVGIAALAAGAVLAGVAVGKKDDAYAIRKSSGQCTKDASQPELQARCDEMRSAARTADAFGNTGIGLFVAGGVVVAGAAAYWFWPSSKAAPSKSGSRLVPIVGMNGGGLLWTGSF